MRVPGSNPFATRYTAPGAIPYQFPTDFGMQQLTDRWLGDCHGRGLIVGPHGSGKTSLLHSWVPSLGPIELVHQVAGFLPSPEARPQTGQLQAVVPGIRWFRLTHQQRALQAIWDDSRRHWRPELAIVVDGYEQLHPWARWRLLNRCRRLRCRLIVTSHRRSLGIKTLWRTDVSPELGHRLISQLLERNRSTIRAEEWTKEQLSGRLERQSGNFREVLFELYDLAEQDR
jgi:GTPase SAR1 family protein